MCGAALIVGIVDIMKVLALVFLIAVAYAKHEEYIGWKTYSVTPSNQEQLQALGRIHYEYELDILSKPSVEHEGVVLVNPQNQARFIKFVEDAGIPYKVHREDVKAALDFDDEVMEAARRDNIARNGKEMPYDNYQRYDVILEYMEDIANRFPDTVTLVYPTDSFEGRPIKYLKISTTNFEDTTKPVIVMDSATHAREWITPPTVTYMIRKLTEDVTDPDLLNNFDWVLIPVVNPDGYEFSFTDNRWWRKSRSTDHPQGITCPGVDGNRNYDYQWNTVGVSANPCGDTYPGPSPNSEIEIRVVVDALHEHLSRTAMFLSMHSHGSMVLYPWGTDGSLSDTAFNTHSVGIAMSDAIRANQIDYFPRYRVGNSVLVIGYATSGSSQDYAHSIGIPLSYTYELPGLVSGLQGFNLPPQYIEQVSKETYEGIAAGARRAAQLYEFN